TYLVDEKRRRAGHAVAPAFGEILRDALARLVTLEIAPEPLHIESEFGRKLHHESFADRRLLVIKPVMHLPKTALPGGGLCCARDEGRARMGALIRKMTEDIGQTLAESLAQPVENRAKPSAVGAEIVAVEHDVHDTFGGASAAHMIPGEIDG